VLDRLRPFPQVEKVWLFGSRARGDAAPRADIDLAVACPAAGRRDWLDIEDAVDDADTLLKVDLVRLEEAPPELQTRVRDEGRLVYDREAKTVAR
jgi:predicted nucleotidyltransferase